MKCVLVYRVYTYVTVHVKKVDYMYMYVINDLLEAIKSKPKRLSKPPPTFCVEGAGHKTS